ncbi:pilus assembly protein [Pontiellaceae bacterium B1224]|nr:pilus assembly protein [Pontiellaceae bacterium B1224]
MQKTRTARKEGAAIVESCLVIIVLCLILFGLLQVSYLIMSRDVISFSAFASARALTVGMNEEFVERVARVTTIPSAGPPFRSGPQHTTLAQDTPGRMWDNAVESSPGSDQFWYEHYLIPWYLGAEDESQLDSLLNYHYWVSSDTAVSAQSSAAGSQEAEVTVSQNVPLAFPFARAFFHEADMGMMLRGTEGGAYVYEEVPVYLIEQTIRLENHSELYLINN